MTSESKECSDAEVKMLIDGCISALDHAYCPYSNFYVGSSVLTTDGKMYTGCNVENASYGLCICAERVALVKAVSDGYRKFKAIAVTSKVSGSYKASCGACRQFMVEFGLDWTLYLVQPDRSWIKISIADLMPMPFTPSDLEAPRE